MKTRNLFMQLVVGLFATTVIPTIGYAQKPGSETKGTQKPSGATQEQKQTTVCAPIIQKHTVEASFDPSGLAVEPRVAEWETKTFTNKKEIGEYFESWRKADDSWLSIARLKLLGYDERLRGSDHGVLMAADLSQHSPTEPATEAQGIKKRWHQETEDLKEIYGDAAQFRHRRGFRTLVRNLLPVLNVGNTSAYTFAQPGNTFGLLPGTILPEKRSAVFTGTWSLPDLIFSPADHEKNDNLMKYRLSVLDEAFNPVRAALLQRVAARESLRANLITQIDLLVRINVLVDEIEKLDQAPATPSEISADERAAVIRILHGEYDLEPEKILLVFEQAGTSSLYADLIRGVTRQLRRASRVQLYCRLEDKLEETKAGQAQLVEELSKATVELDTLTGGYVTMAIGKYSLKGIAMSKPEAKN